MWRSFLSSDFITRYYGEDSDMPVYGMSDTTVRAHDYIRRHFGTMLFSGPKHLMAGADRNKEGFTTIHIFEQKRLSPWAADILDSDGLLEQLSEAAQDELFAEITAFHQAGHFPAFPRHNWWRWVLTDDALFTELLPEANPMGGNIPPRSLYEIFGKT